MYVDSTCIVDIVSDLGWATEWCGIANGSEGCVHRAGRYITVTRPTIFVVARGAVVSGLCVLGGWCRRPEGRGFESEVRLKIGKRKISNNIFVSMSATHITDQNATILAQFSSTRFSGARV